MSTEYRVKEGAVAEYLQSEELETEGFVEDCPVCRGKGYTIEPDGEGFLKEAECLACDTLGVILRKAG